MKFLANFWNRIKSFFSAIITFFKTHIRFTIILSVLLLALLLVIVFHNGVEIVSADFGSYWSWETCSCERNNLAGCAIFGSDLKGIAVNNSCVAFEWYPLFFGCSTNHYKSYDNCASPVLFGIDILALSCAGQERNYYYPESTYLPAKLHTRKAEEGKDYVISNIKYTLRDSKGNSFSSSNPKDLFTSEVYEKIRQSSIALIGNTSFSISISYDIEATNEMEMTCIGWATPTMASQESDKVICYLVPGKKETVSLWISLSGDAAMYSKSIDIGLRNEANVTSYSIGE